MKGPALAESWVSTVQTLCIYPSLHFPFLSSPFLNRNSSSCCCCESPEACDCVSPLTPLLCPFCNLSPASLSATHLPPLSPHSPPSPVCASAPLTRMFSVYSFLPLSPSAPLGTNPGNLDHSEVGREVEKTHACTAHPCNSQTHNCRVGCGDFV